MHKYIPLAVTAAASFLGALIGSRTKREKKSET
jgi:hypothetical protein